MASHGVCLFKDIQKAYGKVKVIHGIGFRHRRRRVRRAGRPVGLRQEHLLRMLAGLEEISGGEILIDDTVVNDLESKDRDIAMVFQSYALYPHMTVRENMGFSLRLRKADAADTAQRVDDAARILNLDKLLDRYPRELSGGQRQRVAMGRAIVRDPKVFLFDEPLSNLDAKLRVAMRAEIKALHQRLKTTTVYVTHDQIEAMTMADRIVVMHDGIVEQIGTPLELFDRPGNLFVAQFIGSPAMNVFDGTLRGGAVEALGRRWPVRPDSAATGREVHYGIRPTDLTLAEAGIAGPGGGDRAHRRRDRTAGAGGRAAAGGGHARPHRRPARAHRAPGDRRRQGPCLRPRRRRASGVRRWRRRRGWW
jgi:multiple sugar transport system ATP-binding protein